MNTKSASQSKAAPESKFVLEKSTVKRLTVKSGVRTGMKALPNDSCGPTCSCRANECGCVSNYSP